MGYTAGKRSRICSPWGVWEGDRMVTECMYWSRQDAEQHAKDMNREAGLVLAAEAARLRPLLERCLRLCDRLLADDTPTTPIPREDMASNVRADLRRELGKEE